MTNFRSLAVFYLGVTDPRISNNRRSYRCSGMLLTEWNDLAVCYLPDEGILQNVTYRMMGSCSMSLILRLVLSFTLPSSGITLYRGSGSLCMLLTAWSDSRIFYSFPNQIFFSFLQISLKKIVWFLNRLQIWISHFFLQNYNIIYI